MVSTPLALGGLQNAWLGRARIVVPLSHSLVLIKERVRLELLARHSQRIMMNRGGPCQREVVYVPPRLDFHIAGAEVQRRE